MDMGLFKTIIKIYETESTMDLSKKLFDIIEPPFLVIADTQKKGRGQHKKEWYSPAGGLWFTETINISTPLGLSTYISIPIMRVLKRYVKNVFVKWPNDILVESKKIAGILTEIKGNTAFIGIGINIENRIPDELKEIATSIIEQYNLKKFNKDTILNEIIQEQTMMNNFFFENGFKYFKEEYEKNLILMHKEISVKTNKTIRGKVKGISDQGELILQTKVEEIKLSYGAVISYK
jgi:BirA family biotin operon repressor/biotin-[acetyl-CoA-carboxylase] ligase